MRSRARYLHGPVTDAALALCWLPLACAAHALAHDPSALRLLVGTVFMLSFFHQPLTLALVYGDRVQYQARQQLYRWTPVVALAAILIGLHVSLAAVAVVGGLWNAEHTLMQRYGVTRMYGRKAGDDNGALEKAMIFSWLGLVMVWLAGFADLPALVQRIGMGGTNARGVAILHDFGPLARWLLVPTLAVVAVTGRRWWLAERALGDAANPAKHLYLAATAALVLTVLVDPIAGFAGYVGSHAFEYFVIVHRSLRNRARTGDRSALALASATAGRRVVLYVGYFVAVLGLVLFTWNLWGGRLYGMAILFFGALHIFYDGFVWKLRRPQLAASLGVPVTT